MKQFQIVNAHLQMTFIDSGRNSISRVGLKRKLLPLVGIFSSLLKGKGAWQFSVTICGKVRIRGLNRRYRGKDKITDVLSFPVHDFQQDFPLVELGDIFICKEVARRQARQFGVSEDDEIIHLLVHGFLHLLGYDHEKNHAAQLKMQKKEDWILDQLREKYGRKTKN